MYDTSAIHAIAFSRGTDIPARQKMYGYTVIAYHRRWAWWWERQHQLR